MTPVDIFLHPDLQMVDLQEEVDSWPPIKDIILLDRRGDLDARR